jgi:MOSC domain-containing protein YiiM
VSDEKGTEIPYRIGVMGIVLVTGEILKGEGIQLSLPPEPYRFMVKV